MAAAMCNALVLQRLDLMDFGGDVLEKGALLVTELSILAPRPA
jgi:hypothetical protein